MKSKHVLIFLFIGVAYWHILACGGNKTGDYKKQDADTTQSWVFLVTPYDRTWQANGVQPDLGTFAKLFKIRKDTLMFDSTDINTLTKKWKRDSIYIIQIDKPIMDSATKKQKVDTSGKSLFYPPLYLLVDKKFIHDFNMNPNKP